MKSLLSFQGKTLLIVPVTNNEVALKTIVSEVKLSKETLLS